MKRQTGKNVKSTTVGETVNAFVPFPLPPKPSLKLTPKTCEMISKAEEQLSNLNIAMQMIPNPEILIYGLVRKEALVSSQIEGTQASMDELVSIDNLDSPSSDDLEEVCNYLKAINFSWKQLDDKKGIPLSLRLLKETHKILLKGIRGNKKTPGMFRKSQNWIGGSRPGNAKFVPPPPLEMKECLNQLELYIHKNDDLNPLIKIALIHVQFETIHPFLDGNGRLGRLLIILLLNHWKLLNSPLLYLSVYFKEHRDKYYRLLNSVRTTGNWESWIIFFLDAIVSVSNETVKTAETLFKITQNNREKLLNDKHATVVSFRVLEILPELLIFDIDKLARKLSISRPPVRKAIDLLEKLKIIKEITGQKRGKCYSYKKYLDVLSEGTK